jgi:hypothetical protein
MNFHLYSLMAVCTDVYVGRVTWNKGLTKETDKRLRRK